MFNWTGPGCGVQLGPVTDDSDLVPVIFQPPTWLPPFNNVISSVPVTGRVETHVDDPPALAVVVDTTCCPLNEPV
jgi:hypothetical protein